MLPREPKSLRNRSPFTGFVAYYDDGKVVKERENFFSKKLDKKCATSWAEIDKNKLVRLEIVWHDQVKGHILKQPSADSFNESYTLSPQDWFFSQKGYYDLNTRVIRVIARNIGYIENGIANVLSVVEESGVVQMYRKKVGP